MKSVEWESEDVSDGAGVIGEWRSFRDWFRLSLLLLLLLNDAS